MAKDGTNRGGARQGAGRKKKSVAEKIATGLRKMGAILGDGAEIGCNAVLNPGTIIGRNCIVYPTSCVRGILKENSIHTNMGEILPRK